MSKRTNAHTGIIRINLRTIIISEKTEGKRESRRNGASSLLYSSQQDLNFKEEEVEEAFIWQAIKRTPLILKPVFWVIIYIPQDSACSTYTVWWVLANKYSCVTTSVMEKAHLLPRNFPQPLCDQLLFLVTSAPYGHLSCSFQSQWSISTINT